MTTTRVQAIEPDRQSGGDLAALLMDRNAKRRHLRSRY
jgi:hypothetical protein